MNNTFYVIDSCSFIDILDCYPVDVFPTVWDNYESLVHENRIGAPRKVYKEIGNRKAESLKWVTKHSKKIFHDDSQFAGTVKKIQADFPNLADYNSPNVEADPFVVAMAFDFNQIQTFNQRDVCVVTEESRTKRGSKDKIPTVCDYYSINCFKFVEMMNSEGWKF